MVKLPGLCCMPICNLSLPHRVTSARCDRDAGENVSQLSGVPIEGFGQGVFLSSLL
jgi:hypothetical protein